MARYLYKAKSSPAKLVEGTVEAEDYLAAITKISRLGLTPIEVLSERGPSSSPTRRFKHRISHQAVAICIRQLSELLEAGLTLLNALQVVSQQTPQLGLRQILEEVAETVKGGASLSQALSRYPKVFPQLYVALVSAGESSGALGVVLEKLADTLEAEGDLRGKVLTALAYPLVLCGVGSITVWVLLSFVVPRLAAMFGEMGQTLPIPTQVVLASSQFVSGHGWLIGLLLFLGVVSFRRVVATSRGRLFFDRKLLKIPLVGKIIVQSELGRFGRMLGLLIGQGVPMLQGLGIVHHTVQNEVLKADLARIQRAVEEGSSLEQAVAQAEAFPIFVRNLISVGEAGGQLQKALEKIARSYEREVDRTMKVFTSLLEPMLILAMGTVVGGIVIAMLLPIFQLNFLVR